MHINKYLLLAFCVASTSISFSKDHLRRNFNAFTKAGQKHNQDIFKKHNAVKKQCENEIGEPCLEAFKQWQAELKQQCATCKNTDNKEANHPHYYVILYMYIRKLNNNAIDPEFHTILSKIKKKHNLDPSIEPYYPPFEKVFINAFDEIKDEEKIFEEEIEKQK